LINKIAIPMKKATKEIINFLFICRSGRRRRRRIKEEGNE